MLTGLVLNLGLGQWLGDVFFESPALAGVTVLVTVWIFGRSIQDVVAESLRGFHSVGSATVFGGLLSTACSAIVLLGVLLANYSITLHGVLYIVILSLGLNAVVGYFVLFRTMPAAEKGQSLPIADVRQLALPLWGSALISMVLVQLDMWVLGATSKSADVALYGTALKLAALIDLPLLVVNSVVPPIIVEMYSNAKYDQMERILRLMSTLATILAVSIGLIFMFAGEFVLGVAFGEQYSEAAVILGILTLGRVILVWGGACGYVLSMTGHQQALLRIMVATACMALLISYPVAMNFGATGMAWVTTSWILVLHAWALLEVKKRLGIWTQSYFNPLYAIKVARNEFSLSSIRR
jgi:O-antigen/teichoic acid export membrane protein